MRKRILARSIKAVGRTVAAAEVAAHVVDGFSLIIEE